MRVRPFAAVRPADTAAAGRVACPPYDVVSAADAVAAAAASPDTFLRVVLPECGLPDGGGSGPDAGRRRHQAAAATLARLTDDGLLVREAAPALYVYELSLDGGGGRHTQRGLVATVSVGDYQAGVIRVHEDTRAAKEAERVALTDAVNAHTGPVFLTHPDGCAVGGGVCGSGGVDAPLDGGPVSVALDAAVRAAGEPLFSFTADDACGPVTHTVWRVDGPASTALTAAYEAHVPAAYVADGHHRAASAAAVGVARQKAAAAAAAAAAASGGTPPAPADADIEAAWFLAVLFPVSQMRLLPYHRAVRALPEGTSAESFLAALSAVCDVAPSTAAAAATAAAAPAVPVLCGAGGAAGAPPTPPRPTVVHAYLRRQWYRVTLPALPSSGAAASGGGVSPSGGHDKGGGTDMAAALDCARLQAVVLGPLLGIDAPRTDPRMEFVGGDGGVPALQATVDGLDKAAAAAAASPAGAAAESEGGGAGEPSAAVAFAMAPVAVADLLAVSDAGGRMPPKSTWFSPKLRSGLFVHTF